jgi:hypothetical protein
VIVIPWRIERRNLISVLTSIVAVIWWYNRCETRKRCRRVCLKSVGGNLVGGEGESEFVLGGEIAVDIGLSLTFGHSNCSAGRGRLFTFQLVVIWVSSSLSSSSPFYFPSIPYYLSISCLLLPVSVLAIMPSKAELVKDIYLLLATIHLHDFKMSAEMAQKILDRWREFLLHLPLTTPLHLYTYTSKGLIR